MIAPVTEQRLERPLFADGLVVAIDVGRFEQDVQVAHRPEPSRDLAQAVPVPPRPTVAIRLAEYPPRGALAAGRHAHRMDVLEILAVAYAGFPREHPPQVEAHDLATGLGDVVVGQDAGGASDHEATVMQRRSLLV